ncbi:MAG: prepilin-type N-terminal cleavage/methylation domain-containing protein [Acidobacteria bacterium]|nr:prepilin-type N-terminal cleavage/methylation domain-containing protein [Acidobacteriota bacterium]
MKEMKEERSEGTRTESGFTLLELIVALTLVALMAAALWAAFSISLRSWSTGTARIEAGQAHRYLLDTTRKQIASAYPLQAQATGTQSTGPQPAAPSPVFYGTSEGLMFVSLSSRRFFESPGLTLAAYRAVPDDGGTVALVAGERRYTGGEVDPEAPPEGSALFNGLAECVFEYFDPGREGDEARWVPEWDGSASGTLPAAVRLTLVSPGAGSGGAGRQMVIPIRARDTLTASSVLNPFAAGGRGARGRPRGATEGGPQGGMRGGPRGRMPEGMPEGIRGGPRGRFPEGMPEGIRGGPRGRFPEGMPEGMPDGRRGGRRGMGGRP